MNLRPYQKKAVAAVRKHLRAGQRTVLVAPTGSGKTVMGAHIAKATKGRVLWVAHRQELLAQAAKHLRDLGCTVGVLSGVSEENPGARILVVSVAKAVKLAKAATLIVIDECHRVEAASYKKIVEQHPGALLGLTATPWRLDGKGLGRTFQELVLAAEPAELVRDGYIAQPVTYGVPRRKARELTRGVSDAYRSTRDFGTDALARAMMKPQILGDVVSEHARLAGSRKTVVFAVNIAHAKALARRFRQAGKRAAVLSGDTPDKQRVRVLADFGVGHLDVIVNVDILSEGFDMPSIQCVSMARPTKSLSRYLQYVGRVVRPYGGDTPVVIDHVGNAWRHGLHTEDREWSLADRSMGASTASVSTMKRCPNCEMYVPAATGTCNGCGHVFEVEDRTAEDPTVLLEEIPRRTRGVSFMKTCVVCSREYKATTSTANRRFCSLKCKGLEHRNRPKPPSPVRQCKGCGVAFPVEKYKAKRYCTLRCRGKHEQLQGKTIACLQCGKSRHWKPNEIPAHGVKFCDHACKSAYKKAKRMQPCAQCGESFDPVRTGRQFCSRDCAGRAHTDKASAALHTWRACSYCKKQFRPPSLSVPRKNYFCCREHFSLYTKYGEPE